MTRRRSTFRRKSRQGHSNTASFGYRAAFDERNAAFFGLHLPGIAGFGMRGRDIVIQGFHMAAAIGRDAMAPLPGETHRQMAERLRAETQAQAQAKPVRKSRAKKAAA